MPPSVITPEVQFLINCCKTNPTASDIEQIRVHISQLNNQQLSEMSNHAHTHGTFPLAYHSIQTHTADLLPKQTQAELKQQNMAIVMQNMHMTAELIRIIKLFKDNGIESRAFKGPGLAQLAYGDITLRQFCDLDILIKKQDIAKSIALLKNDKYIPEITLTDKTREMFFLCVNVIGLEKSIRIEIHWELVSKNYAIDWKEAELWKNNDTTNINGHTIPVLLYNTHLLYLCAHGSKHLFERLEWVCDIDRFIKSNPALAWQSLLESAQTKGLERILLLSLYLCQELLASALPNSINARIKRDPTVTKIGNRIIELNFSSANSRGLSYGTFSLLWQMREKLSDRLRFAYRAIFAPKFDDFKYLTIPKQLQFLYPAMRPIRLLVKYLQK